MNTQPANPDRRKGQKFLFYVLGLLLGCMLLYFGMVAFAHHLDNQPEYIEVNIDFPGEKDWWYADHSIRSWDDGPKYFIWRRETIVDKYAPDNFKTQESVVEYIEKQLVEAGWKRAGSVGWWPCDSVMPESAFLEWRKTYFAYKKENEAPTLCLAVWPFDEDNDTFHVIIMTENPSLLTVWQKD